MNVDDYMTHARGATKALAELYEQMAEVRLRPTTRKWNKTAKLAELEALTQKIQENKTYSKHLTTALHNQKPTTHDDVVTLTNVESRVKSLRRTLATAEALKVPQTKQRRQLKSELESLLEQRKTLRNAWAGMVHVTLKLKVTVEQNGYMKDLTIDTKTVQCRNTESAKNKAIEGIIRDVMYDIELYQDVVDSKGTIGTLHHSYTNPNDPHEMKIQYDYNSSQWTPGETMFSSVEVIIELPNAAHHANSERAPTIPGLTSHPDPIYGCAVGAFYHYLSTNGHRANRNIIFKRLFNFDLTAEESDDDDETENLSEELTPISGPMGASKDEIVNYLTNYFPKSVRWYLHVGISEPIKATKPKDTSYQIVHFTLDNHHLYIGERKSRIAADNLPTEIIEGEMTPEAVGGLIDDFKDNQLLIRMPISMDEFCVKVVEQTNIIPAVQVGPTGVERVIINDCVYIENNEYESRQKVWNKMQAKYKDQTAFEKKFSDQTATQITKQLMDVYGLKTDMFESYDNPHAIEIYQENLTGPFQAPIDRVDIDPENLKLVDLKKCYFQLVHMLRDARLPVFHACDSWEFAENDITRRRIVNSIMDKDVTGEVLIKQFTVFGAQVSQKVWPSCIVKLLIDRKWISNSDVLAMRVSSRSMPIRAIYDFLIRCYDELVEDKDESAFKMIYTRLFGYFGIREEKFCFGRITTSHTTATEAIAAGWQSKYLKYDPERNYKDIYLIYQESARPKEANFNPLFRFAACGSTVMLLDLVTTMRTMMPEVSILSGRVDGLYFQNVTPTQLANFEAHLQTKTFSIPRYNKTPLVIQKAVLEDNANYKCVIREFGKSKRCNPFPTKTKLGSLTTGEPGVGKSKEMARQAREDVIDSLEPVKILFTTIGHKVKRSLQEVADLIKAEFPLHVQVTVKVIAAFTELYRKRALNHKFDFIYVDECGQLGDEDLKTLYSLHINHDRCTQRWYGDQNQLKGINRVVLNMESSALKWLLPTRTVLEYKFDGTTKHRMTQDLHTEAKQFWNTGRLTPKLLARFKRNFHDTGLQYCANNMTVSNKKCREVDAYMKKRGLVMEREWYVVVNKTISLEVDKAPLRNKREKIKLYNGDLISEADRVKYGLKFEGDHVDVRPASCLTAHRIQGSTVDSDWVIWDPLHTKMTREAMYVMLTRGRDLNLLHGVCGNLEILANHIFPKAAEYNPGCLDYENYLETTELKYQTRGWIIYRIEDVSLKVSYVGITHCATDSDKDITEAEKRRLGQHLEEKIPQGKLTKEATIDALHWFRAVEHDPKYENVERFFIEWDIENSAYKNINEKKIDKAIKKRVKKAAVEIEKPEPELSDKDKINKLLEDAGFSPIKVDEAKKFITWSQRFDKGAKGVVTKKKKFLSHDRVEWILYESIKAWITNEGQQHERIRNLSRGVEWL